MYKAARARRRYSTACIGTFFYSIHQKPGVRTYALDIVGQETIWSSIRGRRRREQLIRALGHGGRDRHVGAERLWRSPWSIGGRGYREYNDMLGSQGNDRFSYGDHDRRHSPCQQVGQFCKGYGVREPPTAVLYGQLGLYEQRRRKDIHHHWPHHRYQPDYTGVQSRSELYGELKRSAAQ